MNILKQESRVLPLKTAFMYLKRGAKIVHPYKKLSLYYNMTASQFKVVEYQSLSIVHSTIYFFAAHTNSYCLL